MPERPPQVGGAGMGSDSGLSSTPSSGLSGGTGVSSSVAVDPAPGAGRGLGHGQSLERVPEQAQAAAVECEVPDDVPDRNIDELTKKTAKLDIIELVSRPGFGVTGSKAMVLANYFQVAMKGQELTVVQYHIEVTHIRMKLTRDEKRVAFLQCINSNPNVFPNRYSVAYDGDHLCFSTEQLKFPDRTRPGVHVFKLNTRLMRMERPEEITVQFLFVGVVHVTTRTVNPAAGSERYTTPMQILDVLFRQQRSSLSEEMSRVWYPYGPTVYRIPENGGSDLTCGRVIWQGLFGATHVGQNYIPYVNFDVSHSGFYKQQSMVEFMIDILNANFSQRRNDFSVKELNANTKLSPAWVQAINREVKGLKVIMEIRRANGENYEREYRINSMIGETAIMKEFEMRTADGQVRKISVAEYFTERYGQIRYPNLNLLHVGSRKKECFVPLEGCRIAPNQRVNKKLTADQLNIMIKAAAINAPNRRDKIGDLVLQSGFKDDPWLKAFGVRVNPEMKQVESRILPPPKIQFGATAGRGNPIVEPKDGVWDSRNQKFFIPASCNTIGALVIDDRDYGLYGQFFGFLMKTCIEFGMRVPANIDTKFIRAISPNATAEIEARMTELVNMGVTFIVVTMPQKSSIYYSEVKRVAEIVLGVMTQCVVKNNIQKTMQKMDRMTTANIALKINTKMGGINSKTQADALAQKVLLEQSTLVLGIDVTHPSPLEHKAPSVASVVGNLDDTFMRYGASVRVQKHRREALVYLQDPVRERLVEYFTFNQNENEQRQKAGQSVKADLKPQRLIIFRDGVAEGQFQEVLREELGGIREACKQLGADYKPKITVIVAQKRHHARFFPTSQQTSCGRAMNIRPGTVVDKDITHPEQFEFYLCSHFGIQGTSRPIRYHVLYDDSNFSADHIQVMTYYMCHLYARCTRTVSIPAPIYYADLACRRARAHLYDKISDFSSDTMSSRSGTHGEVTSGISEDELIKSSTVAGGLKMRMYFA